MRKFRSIPENRERIKRLYTARNKSSPKNAFRLMIFNARKRHDINFTADDVYSLWEKQERKCAITGIVMTWSQGRIESTSISLDRLDSDKPYTLDNVRLVCHAVNCFRGRMSDAEMVAMARAIVAKHDALTDAPSWNSYPAFINESDYMSRQ